MSRPPSFDAGVPRSKMTIILLMHSLVLGGGTPVAPGSILQTSTSCATDRQSLCLLSLNAQMNSSKAVVRVSIQPSLSLNTRVVYKSLQPDILGDEFKNIHSHDIMSFCQPLVLAFGKQEIEYEFDLYLFLSVAVNQVFLPLAITSAFHFLSSLPAK